MNEFFYRERINIDASSTCTLKCGGCERENYNGKIPGQNLKQEWFDKLENFFPRLIFSGQISDPIFHPLLPKFLEIAKQKNKRIQVHVAATHRSEEWFRKCFEANENATWYFGIDGLPEYSNNYRVNQDGKKLFEMMKIASTIVKEVYWQFLSFDYNRGQEVKAKQICNELGIKFFNRKQNRRIHGRKKGNDFNPIKEVKKIKPKCFSKKPMATSSEGYLLPCCFHATHNPGEDTKKLMDPKLNLDNADIPEIVFSDQWDSFYNKLLTNPPDICKFFCGPYADDIGDIPNVPYYPKK